MTTGREQLIVFVKAPRPGFVKTRLAEALGTEGACSAYRTVVTRLFDELQSLPSVELRYSPDDALAEIQPWLRPTWTAKAQGHGDLGERLIRAFGQSLSAGSNRVLIIGSDCPSIQAADIKTAWSALDSHSVVLGPAWDGGYWLIGLREPQPFLFAQIPWSTDAVLHQTLKKAHEAGLTTKLLRELRDVDTLADWEEFVQSTRLAS